MGRERGDFVRRSGLRDATLFVIASEGAITESDSRAVLNIASIQDRGVSRRQGTHRYDLKSGIARIMNSLNRGTVKAMSPCAGL